MANPHPDTSHLAPPWPKGTSGNPGGRKRRVLSDRYAALMESVLPEELRKPLKLPAGALWGDAIALVSARTALRSSETGVAQRKELRESIEGKAAQRIEVHPFGDGPPKLVVVYAPPLPQMEKVREEKIIDVTPADDAKQLPASEADESEKGSDQ
jgi:hypothetical protein